MKKEDIKILLADDHPLMRDGVKAVFESEPGYTVVGEVNNGAKVFVAATELSPDVIIMDIGMPDIDGIEATKRIADDIPEIKVIIFSMHSDAQYALDAFRFGALGYVIKGAGPEEIIEAVVKVMKGKRYASPCIAEELFGSFVDMVKDGGPRDAFDMLTKREKEVLKLIANGLTSKEIGEELFISPSTVKTHRTNLMMKLEVNDLASLVKIAIRKGLVKD